MLPGFVYDVNDRPTRATDDFATPASATDDEQADYTYTDDGLLATRILSKSTAGGLVQESKATATYFFNRQLKTLVNADGLNSMVEQHTLDYVSNGVYANGNKVSDVFQLKGPVSSAPCWSATCTAAWVYDARDRLVFEDAGTGDTGPASSVNLMTLDTIGNVTFDSGSNQTRVYSGQKLISDGSSKYIYDAFGNVDCLTPSAYAGAACPTSGSNLVKDYIYDFKNRMVGTRDYTTGTLTKSSDITIDPLDRPIKQVDTPVGGTVSTTTMVYQGASDRLSREIVAAATTSTRGYWYGGFAERLTISDTTAGRLNYVYDQHGSVSLLLDQANAVKKSYGYAGYGGSIGSVTKNAAGFTDPNKYQYTGKRWDTATGTYDIGLRRYTPGSSRWLQQDLYYDALDNLGLSADPMLANRYLFVGANPVNFIELDGHVLEKGGEGGISPVALDLIERNEAEETRAFWADAMSCSKAEQKRGECKPGWSRAWNALELLSLISAGGVTVALARTISLRLAKLGIEMTAKDVLALARSAKKITVKGGVELARYEVKAVGMCFEAIGNAISRPSFDTLLAVARDCGRMFSTRQPSKAKK